MTQDEWIYAALLKLIDPNAPFDPAITAGANPRTLWRLLAIARVHGVLGIAFDKLRELLMAQPDMAKTVQRSWRGEFIKSLRMRRHTERVLQTLSAHGIPAVVLKGSDFADHLYPKPILRPARDVDILLPPGRWNDAVAALKSTGHTCKGPQPDTNAFPRTKGEGSWQAPPPSREVVELHWNLINALRWRARVSVEYCHLMDDAPAEGPKELSPAARFVVAALHPIFHHQFDRMILLADVRQACRQLTTDNDVHEAIEITNRTGSQVAVNASLGITARVFRDHTLEEFRRRLTTLDPTRPKPLEIPESIFVAAESLVRTVAFRRGMHFRTQIRAWVRDTI